jgi:hypothetical protein
MKGLLKHVSGRFKRPKGNQSNKSDLKCVKQQPHKLKFCEQMKNETKRIHSLSKTRISIQSFREFQQQKEIKSSTDFSN